MNRMRAYLTEQLAAKVSRHGMVVWADPHSEYREAAEAVVPEDVAFYRFDGSWYELRRQVEPQLARREPRLVVYLDIAAPEEDPLEELRASGTEYRLRLSTLVRQTMADELASAKIDEITKAAATLTDAEMLIAGGMSGGPARLVHALGVSEPTEIVLVLIRQGRQVRGFDSALQEEAASFLRTHLGVETDGSPDKLVGSVARHLVLVELADRLGGLPSSLASALPDVAPEQCKRCELLLQRWRNDRTMLDVYWQVMRQVSTDLALADQLEWNDQLTDVDTVSGYEDLAFDEFLRRLSAGSFIEAENLAAARLTSIWAPVGDETQEWHQRWLVSHAVAQLRRLIDSSKEMRAVSVTSTLTAYADSRWRIDRAHRKLEFALLSLVHRERIEDAVRDARQAYDDWLDHFIRMFTSILATEGLTLGELLSQGDIHRQIVMPRAERGPIAYFMVDALRFELGHDLIEALQHQFESPRLDIVPAVALLPSITSVGMANLCPGAGENLQLALNEEDHLVVRIGGLAVESIDDRVSLLRAAHGKVTNLRLDDVFRLSEQELGEQVDGADLVLVRSQEIDEIGESGKISTHLQSFEATVQQLSRAVARLAQRGITQFVITADHGFLALTRELGPHAVIPKPGGRGELHRRAFVGHSGAAGDALIRVPVSKIGLPGDLDVLVPRGLAVIAAGGARGFFHGGASPQELVVPVITVEVQPAKAAAIFVVESSLTAKITSQVFTAKLLIPENLLSEPLSVRAVPVRQSDHREVGVLVTAGGAEEKEGLIRLHPGEEVSLGFRATMSLAKGDKVELQIFDARTDRRLAVSRPSVVARALEVDDEFL
jgi:hypothetical protein